MRSIHKKRWEESQTEQKHHSDGRSFRNAIWLQIRWPDGMMFRHDSFRSIFNHNPNHRPSPRMQIKANSTPGFLAPPNRQIVCWLVNRKRQIKRMPTTCLVTGSSRFLPPWARHQQGVRGGWWGLSCSKKRRGARFWTSNATQIMPWWDLEH